MSTEFAPGLALAVIVLTFGIAILQILVSGLNDVLSNKVLIHAEPVGAKEFRTSFDAWVAVPVIGLMVSMVPAALSWVYKEYGFLMAEVAFGSCILLMMWMGFFFGVLRYDAGKTFKGYTSARSLLAALREREASGDVIDEHDWRRINASMKNIELKLAKVPPWIERIAERVRQDPFQKISRKEVHRHAQWGARPFRIRERTFWKAAIGASGRGWLLLIVALAASAVWIALFGGDLTRVAPLGVGLVIIALVVAACRRVAWVAADAGLAYEAKLQVLEERAFVSLREKRSSLQDRRAEPRRQGLHEG